ncbi:hypothetical protein L596_008191 [Steinernema carpocapsae]|uniref:DUF4440 domain-containing protein n=1 Tax=Steinernema carpocapsae TaxID=34508 RepID=A0A4U5PBP5_STECR|nr:hypothetical protein L596_008191 [Steinernema carpocapsae]
MFSELVESINASASVDEILSFYDSDVEFLAKNTPSCRGHEALRIFYTATQKAGLRFAERLPFELHTLSPFLAIERGNYVIKSRKTSTRGRVVEGSNPAALDPTIAGTYFVLWIKRDDWVIIEECRL